MFSFGVDVAQPATKVLPPPHNPVVDEGTHKRNADCIYFLASPLTCKKGASCEYRHSEAARKNPRDCRYWKAGSCLNPRCSFRHLPLEEKSASAAVPSTCTTPIVMHTATAVAPSNKSKTPCYFFSQGYCAKNDKCPFTHGVATSSRADAARMSAVSGAGNLWQSSQRLLHVPNQSVPIEQQKPLLHGSHISKTDIVPQVIPQSSEPLERLNSPERKENFAGMMGCGEDTKDKVQECRPFGSEESQLKKEGQQGLFDVNKCRDGFVQSVKRSQLDAAQDSCPPTSNRSLDHSDSRQKAKSPSNSTTSSEHDGASSQDLVEDGAAHHLSLFGGQCDMSSKRVMDLRALHSETTGRCMRQRKDLIEQHSLSDLRSHLINQLKQSNMRILPGNAEAGGLPDLVIGGGNRSLLSEMQSRSVRESSASTQIASLSKVLNLDKPLTQDIRRKGSLGGTSNKEAKSFTGPKSLAQIKAEKMAKGKSGVGSVERHNLSPEAAEASKNTGVARKKPKHAESSEVAGKSPGSTVFSIKSLEYNQKTGPSSEFESPKPSSILLKRKRDLQSASDTMETSSALLKLEVAAVDSSRELEDGEVGGDCKDHKEDDILPTGYSVLIQGNLQPLSVTPREMLHGAGVKTTDFDVDFTGELNFDIEMEDVVDGSVDIGVDDDEDDEEDFAKKLGRVFALYD